MQRYRETAWERAMKVREVILRAMAKRITWWQAAEILGITDRSMRRWKRRYETYGYDGLLDRRRGKPSPKRVPLEEAEAVLRLYQERYSDLNVQHFQEKLKEEHEIKLGYTWVKLALQGAGRVKKGRTAAESSGCVTRNLPAERRFAVDDPLLAEQWAQEGGESLR
jgi:transposase